MIKKILVIGLLVSAANLTAAGIDQFEPVRKLVLDKMNKEGLPSMAVAVARDGRIIWEEAWGTANIEKQVPATPQTMYSLASTTKPITATALMILVERGLVDLDKPANLYLGEGKLSGIRPEEATVRRLLRHTAGLPLHWNLIFADETYRRLEMDETIRRYGVLVAPPGEGFSYSNLGYGVLLVSFLAGLKTEDTSRAPHILFLAVKMRGDKLGGSLSAVAMN